MRSLRGRQASLLALQQDAEAKLASTRQRSNESRTVSNDLDDLAASMTQRVDGLSESNAGRPADPDLQDIRQQLQYLRNELKTQVNTSYCMRTLTRYCRINYMDQCITR